MAECFNALPECQKAGESVGVLMAEKKSGNFEGHKTRFPDRSSRQCPWGIHIRNYEEEKKPNSTGFVTWFACGIPRN